ncbi:hypothetical protein M9458_018772, partial [Cirrhinus mrigala]
VLVDPLSCSYQEPDLQSPLYGQQPFSHVNVQFSMYGAPNAQACNPPYIPYSHHQTWRSKAQQEAALLDFQMSSVWCVEIKPRDITTMPSP